jgi:hypothetical protein
MQVSCHNDLPIASRPLSRQVIVHCETMMTMSDIGGTVTAGWFRPSSGRIPSPCQFTKGLRWSHRASAIKHAFVRTFQDRVSWVSRDDRYSGRDRFLNGIAIEMNYWKPTLDPRSYWIRNRRHTDNPGGSRQTSCQHCHGWNMAGVQYYPLLGFPAHGRAHRTWHPDGTSADL